MVALVLAWIVAIVTVLTLIEVAVGALRMTSLAGIPPRDAGPMVSIVVAARNEARGIEPAVRSLLRLDYPSLEILVVNDRSTDGTGAILERVHLHDPRLVVLAVTALPEGWLGKNHALAYGAARARGDLLLFTDADVVFEPSTLARAVHYLEEQQLDHLTAVPHTETKGVALTTLVTSFAVLFALYMRPWRARNPKSRHHVGIGAFNLIRTAAYHRIGTHASIAMRPDDDVRLGKAVKRAGLRQDAVLAGKLISVEWYASAREMIDGLMKNAFAGVNYNVPFLVFSTIALLALNVLPWIGVVAASGTVRTLSAISVTAVAVLVFGHTRIARVSPVYVLLYPLGVLGVIYIMWRSAALALGRGSITWRETSYPLADLKRARPAQPLRIVELVTDRTSAGSS